MGDEGGEGRIQERPSRLPAQNDGFLAIVETLAWNAAKVGECIIMAADQSEEIPSGCHRRSDVDFLLAL